RDRQPRAAVQRVASADDLRRILPDLRDARVALVVLVAIRRQDERILLRSAMRERDQAHRAECIRDAKVQADPMFTILIVDDKPYRVLVIEDEHVIAARIESVLDSIASVTLVSEGDIAIERLTHGQYDCVLLDLALPRLSGFDVLRYLMIRKPELLKATVIMTAAADESLQFIDSATVGGILRKPFAIAARS